MKSIISTVLGTVILTILAGFISQFATLKDVRAVEDRVVDTEKVVVRIDERLKNIEKTLEMILARL